MTLMTTSQKGVDLIKKYEGCKLSAYLCPAGVPTIGYGRTQGVKMGMTITQAQAEAFLKADIKPLESVLNKMGINYTQNQFDAIISWLFNLGVGNFSSSTLKKKILAKASDVEITDQITKWVNAGGKPVLGLKKRRVEEANLFLGKTLYNLDSSGNILKA
jgi:lysozyme